MISQEMLQRMVQEQVAAKLSGNKSVASAAPDEPVSQAGEPAPEPQEEAEVEKTEIPLDELDVSKLENLLLKKELERLRKEAEDTRRKMADQALNDAQLELQNFLLDKYDVNIETHKMFLNPNEQKLIVTPH